jgi:hypothetical protein
MAVLQICIGNYGLCGNYGLAQVGRFVPETNVFRGFSRDFSVESGGIEPPTSALPVRESAGKTLGISDSPTTIADVHQIRVPAAEACAVTAGASRRGGRA